MTQEVKKRTPHPNCRKPRIFFTPEDESTWSKQLFEAGYHGLSLRAASYGVGCSMNLLATTPEALDYFHQGVHARLMEADRALMEQLNLDERDYSPDMQLGIRNLKQNAIKMIMKQTEVRDIQLQQLEEMKKQTKALEDLSDDELKAKARAYLDRKNG